MNSDSSLNSRLTFREIIVVLGVITVLGFLFVPAISNVEIRVAIRVAETKALNNAKTIGLCCKQFAIDHNGYYPSFPVVNSTTSIALISDYSNTAFDQLFPNYLVTIQPFYQPKSAWTPVSLPDPDPKRISPANPALPAGSNEWAYVAGLRDATNPEFPLIADGFADLRSHAYTTDETARGGVWNGEHAIVVFCDDSAKVLRCDPSTHTVPGSPNGADLFDTSGQPGWLKSTGTNAQSVLNPL